MPVPFWPSTLPMLLGQVAGLSTPQLYSPPRETQMDDGPTRTRRQRAFRSTVRTIVLTLTPDQFNTFLGFCEIALNQGAGRFSASIKLPDGSIGVRTCKIQGAPAEVAAGANHRVTFNLTIWSWLA